MRRVLIGMLLGCVTLMSTGWSASSASGETVWSIQPSPNPPASTNAALAAVSCVAGGACQAVGEFTGLRGFQPLAEGFSEGSTWTIEPVPPVALNSYLSGVSCVSASWCMAVGSSDTARAVERALAEIWNGGSWTLVRTPAPAEHGSSVQLLAVSCTSETRCIAVGVRGGAPLAERWNGVAWSVLSSVPNPHSENGTDLASVSCVSDSDCEAGANLAYADVSQSIYALRYRDGAWTKQRQPNYGDDSVDTDSGMSCTAGLGCVSVGSFENIGGSKVLVETYSGSGWSRQNAIPPSDAVASKLDGVSCTGLAACSAVGNWKRSGDLSVLRPLAMSFDGTDWVVDSTPAPDGAELTTLGGVSCVPSIGCTAVGNYYNGSQTKTLVETSP